MSQYEILSLRLLVQVATGIGNLCALLGTENRTVKEAGAKMLMEWAGGLRKLSELVDECINKEMETPEKQDAAE